MLGIKKRALGAGAATVLALAGLSLAASPANATTPTGGCWVYSYTEGDAVESQPTSNISSSLAAWTDPTEPPDDENPADYVLTTSGGTKVGTTRSVQMTVNKGPKNGGPPASGTAYYYFSVNGVNLPPMSQPFTAGAAANIPAHTVNGSFTIRSLGANTVVFRKVIYDIESFNVRVQCNGQTTGTNSPGLGTNPATAPLDTNVVSPAFSASKGTIAVTKAGSITGKNQVGKTLTAKKPTTTPATTVTYQWYRGTKAIKNATTSKLKLKNKDEGKKIKVTMTMAATGYTTSSVTVKAPGKVKAAA